MIDVLLREDTMENQIIIEEAGKFAKFNIVNGINGTQCIDGRYLPNNPSSGMISRPGANFKDIMALLALKDRLDLSVEQCVEKVVNVVLARGEKFYMHTDEHCENGHGPVIGCGHIAKATLGDISPHYGVSYRDVLKALEYTKDSFEEDPRFVMVILTGDHTEKAVLINTGVEHTLNHSNGTEMYFVYDSKRDEDYMQKMVADLNISGLTYEEFKLVSDRQLQATLRNLAIDKLLIETNCDEENPHVTAKGKVVPII